MHTVDETLADLKPESQGVPRDKQDFVKESFVALNHPCRPH